MVYRRCSVAIVGLLIAFIASAQNVQRVQVKTFDQQLRPSKNIELLINERIKVNTGERGSDFIEMTTRDFPIRSVEVLNEGFEPASWNFSKGVLEITIRKKNYQLVTVLIVSRQQQPLVRTEVTYTGVRRLKLSTNNEGKIDLPLDLDERITSASQFIISGYTPVNLVATANTYSLTVEPIQVVSETKAPVAQEVPSQSYEKELASLDTAKGLASFYEIISDIPLNNLPEDDKRIVDARFNTLLRAMQESMRAERPAREIVTDTTALTEDIRRLIQQATREGQELEYQRAEFDRQIDLFSRKVSDGLTNLDPEQRNRLLTDIALLEKLLSENRTRFEQNQGEYSQILSELKAQYFDIQELESKLTESEALRLKEQREFRQRLFGILAVVMVFSVLIVVLIRLSANLRKQKKQLSLANNEIRVINANLENIVSKRTKMLREANDELDTFLYKASHDLRTPVASIYGLCNLVDHISKEEFLEKIRSSTARMDRLLTSLNVISEINQPSDYGIIDLRSVAQNILNKFSDDIAQYHVDVLFFCPESVFLKTYPSLLEVVITNMIDNAIFFGSLKNVDGQRMTLSITQQNGRIEIMVEDNGIGIDETIRPNIFNMFFKGTENSRGNGLGLYIISRCLRPMKGSVEVDSQLGVFSKFSVSLPIDIK
ncbi:MAG: HAMP domain-containing histidine kinase [Cyclobacteriaceae bacterium]|nr:HAMP domain-containing histidine kinase [Cyclobacteriaceae bacterium]